MQQLSVHQHVVSMAAGGVGRKAGFVPPFVGKALAANEGGEEAGPLSPKTLEMLAGELQARAVCLLIAHCSCTRQEP